MTAPLPPPGWYPDPNGAPAQRYFDGTKWTDQLAPVSPPVAFYTPVQGPLPPPKSAVPAALLHAVLLHRPCDPDTALDLDIH